MPADRWVKDIDVKNPPADPAKAEAFKNGTKRGLNRRAAAEFVTRLCKYPGDPKVIAQAQRHILEAHADRLSRETGNSVTVEDIQAGRAPRPKVLDMFAGGGAIPLEALRLGCEAYALDLNPVAYIIELCTLVYPQKYGRPDPAVRGMTGPKNERDQTTWGGLAAEVRYWGEWVLKKVKAEIGDLYPLIPDPGFKGKREPSKNIFGTTDEVPPGYLVPVAYLWTRTVTCKNPSCKATVPLVKQTWLCKKKDRYVALKVVAPKGAKRVRFEVVESKTEKGLGFDPEAGSEGGNATCPFCNTVANSAYVMSEGCSGRVERQIMAVVCTRPGIRGKVFLGSDEMTKLLPNEQEYRDRLDKTCASTGLSVPNEPISPLRPSPNARGLSAVTRHGFKTFGELFTTRQLLFLLTNLAAIRQAEKEMSLAGHSEQHRQAVAAFLAATADKVADANNSLCHFEPVAQCPRNLFGRQAIPMVWDFGEAVPVGEGSGSWVEHAERAQDSLKLTQDTGLPAIVARGSATAIPWADASLDAVVTDPPYYDNVPYADISDFFYVWLKRSLASLFPDHFASELTPKKTEATALSSRHGGDMGKARDAYESLMLASFREAARVLKPQGQMVVVYAHKTTLGWATLVDALRIAGFTVTEAWPLDTETSGRLLAHDTSSLASSIFLVARKREGKATGSYETDVQPDLKAIVRERVETLWDQGISGADLVIACVGAGLRALTRFARVEYANGEEVPAERFLAEVETVVLDCILGRLSKEVGGNGGRTSLVGVDPATRFYTLWRYTYRFAELDAGEAIIFANGTHVELDGPAGLSSGARALVEKKKGKYRLHDFAKRGEDEKLGLPNDEGQPAPLIDALHRTLWLMEHRPTELGKFLREAEPNREQMRLVAQALSGPALKGGEMSDISPTAELSALGKLTANWRSLVEDNVFSPEEQADRKRGQRSIFE